MKKIMLLAISLVLVVSAISWPEINSHRRKDTGEETVWTNTEGIQMQREGTRYGKADYSFISVKIDLKKHSFFQTIRGRKTDEVHQMVKYNLKAFYNPFPPGRDNDFSKPFLEGGVEFQLLVNDFPVELRMVKTIRNIQWEGNYSLTEKELEQIANSTKLDFKLSNSRAQSVQCPIPEGDLKELREFCTKYVGVKGTEKPVVERNEPARLLGLSGVWKRVTREDRLKRTGRGEREGREERRRQKERE